MAEIVNIRWEGPVTYQEAINKYSRDNAVDCDFGLYQIYGPHELYSNKKRSDCDKILLYIGQTTSGSKFSGRIACHAFCHDDQHEIYFGRVVGGAYDHDDELWENAVLDAEMLLINKYTPPYNAKYVGDIVKEQMENPDIIIVNHESRADLDERIEAKHVVYQGR